MRLADYTIVISRRRDTERRARFTLDADWVDLRDWAFFDAVDGEASMLFTSAPSAHGRGGREAPAPLCPGEIGCALSHVAVWRTLRAMRIERPVCILEDDVEFLDPPTFEDRWYRFLRAMPIDAIAAHLAGEEVSPETQPVMVNHHVARVVHTYGTSAMWLTAEAIRMLAEHPDADTMREPADWLLLKLFDTGRVYCPREPLMRHTKAPGITPATEGT